ncbi:hypothetical protein Tco_1065396, partial [Tanacetum coccineum]
ITALEFDLEKHEIANLALLIERVDSGEEGVVLSHGGLGFCRVKGRLSVLGKRGGYPIVMDNPNSPNEPNEDIPEENLVIPEPNHVEDAHDPNEMVDIPDDEELVDYDGDNEEEPKEEPEEEPEPNNGHGNCPTS